MKKCKRTMLVPRPVPGHDKPVAVDTVAATPAPIQRRSAARARPAARPRRKPGRHDPTADLNWVLHEAGALPQRVDLVFTLLPSGRAARISLRQVAWTDSALEHCLQTAIASPSFPSHLGEAQSVTYPFIARQE